MNDLEDLASKQSTSAVIRLHCGSNHEWEQVESPIARPATAAAVADFPPTAPPTVSPDNRPILDQGVQRLLSQLRSWHRALGSDLDRDQETLSSLLMQYHLATPWVRNSLSLHEGSYDDSASLYDFLEILRLGKIYIESKAVERPTFTFEAQCVPILYFMSTKCRVPSLQRQALDLIRQSPGKESLWRHKSVAEMAARLITIEEEGLGIATPSLTAPSNLPSIDDSIMPPEHRRIHHVEILVNVPAHRYDVRVFRYSVDPLSGHRIQIAEDYAM